jgi:hypothetical protein
MASESGLGAAFCIDGWELSGDTNSLERISKSMGLIPQTSIDKKAYERAPGILDGAIDFTSFFNPENAHVKLEDLPRVDVVASYFHRGDDLGTPTGSIVAKQASYDGTRAADGQFTLKVATQANAYWLDWGLSLTAGLRTDSSATNGSSVDFQNWGGGSAFGLQAYAHLMEFTGTSVTIKLQQSSDNGVGDAWADVVGGSFGALSAARQGVRIATARDQTVERYLRVVTTGTFSHAVFRVSAAVNKTENLL